MHNDQSGSVSYLSNASVSRRGVLKALGGLGIGSIAFQRALAAGAAQASGEITAEMIRDAEWVAGIELDEEQRETVADSVKRVVASRAQLRASSVDADTMPALVFRPDFFYQVANPSSAQQASPSRRVGWSIDAGLERKQFSDEDLAFASISEQASLLAAKKVSSRELTKIYLERLKKYDPMLKCIVTLLEDHALAQATAADERHRSGNARGVLDGIPWVAKDLVAVPPWKTTWGAAPFQEQIRPETATVANKLNECGAVLLAKVSLGALAWGDKWFGGTTRNPWNPQQGSSGSSAGSSSAVAAG